MFSPLQLHHHTYPYAHLNHLLTTQHVMQNNTIPPHSQGLQNHGFNGIGQLHSNLSTGYHGFHGLSNNSSDRKERSGTYTRTSRPVTLQSVYLRLTVPFSSILIAEQRFQYAVESGDQPAERVASEPERDQQQSR